MAGRLRGEVTPAAANGLYLVLLLIGGMVFPLSELPGALRDVAELLPAAALSELLGSAAVGDVADGRRWLTMVAWAVAAPAAAALTFRWEAQPDGTLDRPSPGNVARRSPASAQASITLTPAR